MVEGFLILRIKKMLGVVILSVAVLVSGCAEEMIIEEMITEEELVSRVVEAYQKIETAKFSIGITSEVELQTEKFAGIFEMIATKRGVLDNINEDMRISGWAIFPQLPDPSENTRVCMVMYLIDNIMYSKTDVKIDGDFIAPTKWVKEPQDYHDIANAGIPIQILKISEIEFLPDGELNDIECYVIRLTPDVEKFWEITKDYIKDQIDILGIEMFVQDVIDFQNMKDLNLNQMFRDLDIIYWIAKDTFHPIRECVDMTIVLDSEVLPGIPENIEIEIDLKMTNTYHSHNEPVTIKLPEEVKRLQLNTLSE